MPEQWLLPTDRREHPKVAGLAALRACLCRLRVDRQPVCRPSQLKVLE